VNVHLKLLSPEAFFSPKCTKYRLAAGLRPDSLGELTALPRLPSCIRGCLLLGEGKGGVWEGEEGRKEWGGKGREYASLALGIWTPVDATELSSLR